MNLYSPYISQDIKYCKMQKEPVIVALALILGLIFFSLVPPVDTPTPYPYQPPQYPSQPQPPGLPPGHLTFDQAVESITEAELKEMLYAIAKTHRYALSNEYHKHMDYAEARFREAGLQVMRQQFPYRRGNATNLFAWIEGKELPNEILVIGAHFDTVRNCPGADDNGSGSVGVLEVAEAFGMLKNTPLHPRRTIVFQLYDAEEYGLYGSRYYCNNPTFPISNPDIRKHNYMINLDMIGYHGKSMGPDARVSQGEPVVEHIISKLEHKYPYRDITWQGSGVSDNKSFRDKGVKIVWLFTGTHRNYHQTTDTPEKINYRDMQQIVRYAAEILWMMDRE